ncbi:MAG: hypothetical protein GPOALKHO_000398 [Sodalis sp.]|nr:MAG: hypothetical protein GPOALKHO_000398 [Sodalis sp.]
MFWLCHRHRAPGYLVIPYEEFYIVRYIPVNQQCFLHQQQAELNVCI